MNLSKLQYYIIPNEVNTSIEIRDLQNEAYAFWREIWDYTLGQMSLPALDGNEFLRQKYITVIKYEDKIVASHLYSVFDLRHLSTLRSKYFEEYSGELLSYCGSRKVNTILTQEYLSVSSLARKSNTGISFPEVLMGLAVKLTQFLSLDATGGTIRSGVPSVDRVSREINTESIGVKVIRYNMDHSFHIGVKDSLRLPGSNEAKSLILNLWNNKIDLCNEQKQSGSEAA